MYNFTETGIELISKTGIQSQLKNFICIIREQPQKPKALDFWSQYQATLNCLADTALDLLATPASQANFERVFSVCGLLTQECRNRMSKSLEIKVKLKLNANVLAERRGSDATEELKLN